MPLLRQRCRLRPRPDVPERMRQQRRQRYYLLHVTELLYLGAGRLRELRRTPGKRGRGREARLSKYQSVGSAVRSQAASQYTRRAHARNRLAMRGRRSLRPCAVPSGLGLAQRLRYPAMNRWAKRGFVPSGLRSLRRGAIPRAGHVRPGASGVQPPGCTLCGLRAVQFALRLTCTLFGLHTVRFAHDRV